MDANRDCLAAAPQQRGRQLQQWRQPTSHARRLRLVAELLPEHCRSPGPRRACGGGPGHEPGICGAAKTFPGTVRALGASLLQ